MLRPPELASDQPLFWSTGRGNDVWELFQACIAGDLPAVQRLVARDPSLVRTHFAYRKPLYFAVRENRLAVARFLLERDPDPIGLWIDDGPFEIARDRGYAEMERMLAEVLFARFRASHRGIPVAAALKAHDLPRMRRLLDAEPELLHVGDLGGSRPLHWAVMTRQLDAIDELLARGADLNARRMDGARPIHLTNGDYHYRGWRDVPLDWPVSPAQVLEHLKARGAFIDINTAVHTGDVERVREFLRRNPALANHVGDQEGYYIGAGTPLKNAAATGRMDLVILLLEHGANPNLPEEQIAPRGHALYSAVYHGHYDIARLLLERGAYPNPPVESSADALWIAKRNQDARMEALLRSFGANDDDNDLREDVELGPTEPNWLMITPLHHAAGAGKLVKVAYLMARGADLRARDEHLSSTPLAWAAKSGKLATVNVLLALGAPTSLPDDPPWATPLAWATRRGHGAIAERLRAAGATS